MLFIPALEQLVDNHGYRIDLSQCPGELQRQFFVVVVEAVDGAARLTLSISV